MAARAHTNNFLWWLLAVVLIRLITLPLYPLMDTTEARYAEIARIMAETGDWITPYFDYGVPFWGKPPLSFWLSAISVKALGANEFAVRLPSWLCGMVSLYLLAHASTSLGIRQKYLPLLLCISTAVFFVSMGAVMTEASLLLGTVLSQVAVIGVLFNSRGLKLWGYLFFVGLALGMLSKGPIALVLIGVPLVFWAMVHRQMRLLWNQLPWVTGSLLFLALSAPWFLLAEIKTPGFLNYFLIGEHFLRFVEPGWTGDLYGSAHFETRGTIWLFWILAACPLSFVVVLWFARESLALRSITKLFERWDTADYLLLYWAIFPQVFFSFAGNILPAYVAPGIPALALLVARKFEFTLPETERIRP